jgi:dienelactone hydrolase
MSKKLMAIIFLALNLKGLCQTDTVQLIKLTGKNLVGTSVYEWTDESREMKIRPDLSQQRVIVTQFWYPAKPDSSLTKAPYSALSKDYQKTFGNSYLRASITEEIDEIPLIIIVPGRGTERFLYTTIAEELASQGFVVASVDMPEIGYVIFQDGFTLYPSDDFKTPSGMMTGPYELVDAFFERPTEIGYQDLIFSLEKITELNTTAFAGKMDLKTIGVFGHSLGGRIAGALTAKSEQVKALATMEGIPPRDVRYEGKIVVPSLMMCGSGTLKYAEDNYNSFIDNRKNIVYLTELVDFGHNSMTDNPYIFPENFKYEIDPQKALEISRTLLTDFFKEHLIGETGFYEKNKDLEFVKMVKHQ